MNCEELEKELFNAKIFSDNYFDREKRFFDGVYNLVDSKKFYHYFDELFTKSIEESYYWFYCSFSTYKDTFYGRFNDFEKEFVDSELSDFVAEELNVINLYVSYSTILDDRLDLDSQFHDSFLTFYFGHLDVKCLPLDFKGCPELKKKVILALKKKLSFLKEVLRGESVPNLESENCEKQLTVNQCVLLMEEIGVFTGSISDLTKVSKAKLVSLITGKSEKNIKTSIQNLYKKPSDLGVGHQKDIDKIKALLNSME
jgi:hypothetical protein